MKIYNHGERLQLKGFPQQLKIESKIQGSAAKGIVVYKAVHGSHAYILRATKNQDQEGYKKFLNAVAFLRNNAHPGLPKPVCFEENYDGNLLMLLSFSRGVTLRDLLEKSGLSVTEKLGLMIRLANLLSLLHQQAQTYVKNSRGVFHLQPTGIVHRDVKPENIIVGRGNKVSLIDFDLVMPFGQTPEDPGLVAGTPPYMSPEQAKGEALNAQTDLYACGTIIYEIIAGQNPTKEMSDWAAMVFQAYGDHEPIPSNRFACLGKNAENFFNETMQPKLLSRDKTQRYTCAQAMKQDLITLCGTGN